MLVSFLGYLKKKKGAGTLMHSGIVLAGGEEMGSRQYHPNPPTVSIVLFCCIFVASCSTATAADPLWKCFLFLSLFLFGEGESLDWQPVSLLFIKEGFLGF